MLKISNSRALGNAKDGFRFEGDVNVELINCDSSGNGESGYAVVSAEALQALLELGIPRSVDPRQVAELLQNLSQTDPKEREQVAHSSGLLQQLGSIVTNAPALIANLVTIAGEPHVHEVIARLFS